MAPTVPRLSFDSAQRLASLNNQKALIQLWVSVAMPYKTDQSIVTSTAEMNAFLSQAATIVAQMQALMAGLS